MNRFVADANLDMLTDRDNRLTTAVVCDFTGSVAHITATSEGSVAMILMSSIHAAIAMEAL